MFTTAVNGIRTDFPVGGIPGILFGMLLLLWWKNISNLDHLQPVNLPVVGEAEDKLIDNAVNPHSSANEFKCCVVWIVEDEII